MLYWFLTSFTQVLVPTAYGSLSGHLSSPAKSDLVIL